MAKIVVDTNYLIEQDDLEDLIKQYEIIIPMVVLEELDNLNHTTNDQSKKFKIRNAIRLVEANIDRITIDTNNYIRDKNDNKILDSCIENKAKLCTYDVAMKIKAKTFDIGCIETDYKLQEQYKGYKVIQLSDEELAYWYENEFKVNSYDLLCNEYLLIQNKDGEIVDKLKWTDKGYKQVNKKPLQSMMFGTIKPKDAFQELAIDSLMTDQFTILTGHAGTAKTLLSLAYSFWAIQNHKYDRLIIAYNPCVSRGSSNLGYYSGNRDEKLMQSSLGSMLNSKLGDSNMVKTLLGQGTIVLVPTADIRGMEIKENEILYIPEAQNTSVDIMKLCMQRVSEKSKIIAEGDTDTQVDSQFFIGDKNGLQRAINVFKGESVFGGVYLPNIYRSKIADIAERM
jgi:predicted ribonuclease YlaK